MTDDPVSRFLALVRERLGLVFDDGRVTEIADRLARRAEAAGTTTDALVAELAADRAAVQRLAPELTVTETSFFRHREQLDAFSRHAVPALLDRRPGPLRVLSAGCSSGEEPATLAILLATHPRLAGATPSIRAFDVNAAVLARARRGRYGSWALRDTPAEVVGRWFRPVGRDHELDPAIRRLIELEERSLVDDDPVLYAPGAWDVVFCRNVIMYLDPLVQRTVVARFARAIVPGGFLFLGHAETLRGVSGAFHLRSAEGAFFYERREGGPAALAPVPPTPPAPMPAPDETWMSRIAAATERIRGLPLSGARPQPRNNAAVLDLLGQDKHAEAREALGPHDADEDPETLLLRAVVSLQSGAAVEAEEHARALLRRDDLSASAHYVMALCREAAGDPSGARAHDRSAVHLDPAFALPHLHLALLARRAGDRESARQELGRALLLLEREDPARILLFGGGFGRGALLELCRAELRAIDGGAR